MAEQQRRLWSLPEFRKITRSIRDAIARVPSEVAIWADIRAFPPLAVIAALDCVAGLVLWRQYSGGAALHLTNARLCAAGCAVAALAVAGRWWLARIECKSPALWIRTLLMSLGVLPMIVLLSLANSHHSPWAVSFVSALAVMSGGAVLLWHRLSSVPAAATPRVVPSEVMHLLPAKAIAPPVREPKSSDQQIATTPAIPPFHSNSDAWMERTVDETGAVQVQGSLHAVFAVGQTIATVHVSFSPAFPQIPEFSCAVVNAPSVRSRAPAIFRYGARIELKRAGDASAPVRAEIRFQASTNAILSRAA